MVHDKRNIRVGEIMEEVEPAPGLRMPVQPLNDRKHFPADPANHDKIEW
jgi:hypothetical protein